MLTEINGTIKIVNNSNVVLEIEQNNLEKFKEYEHPTGSKKFYADFSLGNKQLCINDPLKENQEDGIVIMNISSANEQDSGKAYTTVAAIKALLGLDDQKKEVKVQMLKHPRKQVEELKTKTQELQDQLDTAQQEKLKAIDSTALQQQLEEKNAKITELEALDAVALQQKLTEKENEITALKAQPNAAQLQEKEDKIKELEAANKKAEEEKAALETANKTIEEKVKELEAAKKEAEEKQKELQTQLDTANTEKTDLRQQLAGLTDEQQKVNTAIEDSFADGSIKTEIEDLIRLTGQDLKDKVKSLYEGIISKLKIEDKGKGEFREELQDKILSVIEGNKDKSADEIVKSIKEELKNSIINASKFSKEVADLKVELEAEKNKAKAQINTLNTEVQRLKTDLAAQNSQVQKLQKEITDLKTKIQQPNAEVEKLKNDLKTKTSQVQQLMQKNKELEAKNKTTEQPKQGNGAKYTATVGMGLAVGLVAFTALERTVKLEMLVMIGIAVASALVAGGITYAVLPSTQVDGAKTQEVSGDKKSKQ